MKIKKIFRWRVWILIIFLVLAFVAINPSINIKIDFNYARLHLFCQLIFIEIN